MVIADYEAERQAFDAILDEACPHRILLFRGTSGSGKTTLLSHCMNRVPGHVAHLRFDLKDEIPVAEVFHRAGQELLWDRLPQLRRQIDEMQDAPRVQIDRNLMAGIGNRITVALHAETPVDRNHRRVLLTDALFADLQTMDRPVLMTFDTFEKASTELAGWIGGQVLPRAIHHDAIRVIIAGQVVPDRHNIVWGGQCREYFLRGVREAHHWLPVIQARGRFVPVPDPISGIATICELFNGDPAQIIKWIETLPERKDLP